MSTQSKIEPIQANHGIWASRQAVEFLYAEIKSDKYRAYLSPYLIAAICAGVEGAINTCYIDFFHEKMGRTYKRYYRPYLMMRIEDRLRHLPLLVSGFKYSLNESSADVKSMLELFELRNKLLHVKLMWHYAEVVTDENGNTLEIKYHEGEDDPYRGDTIEIVKKKDIIKYMNLYNDVHPTFYNLSSRIRRKNYNPKGCFTKVKP